jgi:hypothetical protein
MTFKKGIERPVEQIIEELEAEGINVKAFLKRVHATVARYSSETGSRNRGQIQFQQTA